MCSFPSKTHSHTREVRDEKRDTSTITQWNMYEHELTDLHDASLGIPLKNVTAFSTVIDRVNTTIKRFEFNEAESGTTGHDDSLFTENVSFIIQSTVTLYNPLRC